MIQQHEDFLQTRSTTFYKTSSNLQNIDDLSQQISSTYSQLETPITFYTLRKCDLLLQPVSQE